MIFRRIKAHIEKENWFAVFVDFCIVVVGVFIGIQVANWNEARTEDELAERYIVHLTGDLQSDVADIESGLRTAEWRLAALTALLEKSGVPTLDTSDIPEGTLKIPRPGVENDSISHLMNASTYTRTLDNDAPAYASLVNSGNARLIGKLKPWQCIQSYYGQYQEVRLFEERMLQFRTDLVRTQHDAGISIAGNMSEEETLDRIRGTAPLAAAMSSYRVFTNYQIVVLEDLRQRATLLLQSLAANSESCAFEPSTL